MSLDEIHDLSFVAQVERAIYKLKTDGYCVVPNVLSHSQCEEYIKDIWTWMADLGTGLQQDDPKTWGKDRWPFADRGIVSYPDPSQAPFVWKARAESRVLQVFETAWGTRELVTSLDRFNISKPATVAAARKNVNPNAALWLHLDQPLSADHQFADSEYERSWQAKSCIQGFLNLEDTDSTDAGLIVIPKSHRSHSDIMNHIFYPHEDHSKPLTGQERIELEQKRADFCAKNKAPFFKDKQKGALLKYYSIHHVVAPKGSLILWDSRTIHCNRQASSTQLHPGRFRYGVYVCVVPVPPGGMDPKLAKKRKACFETGRGANHDPLVSNPFPLSPHLWCADDKTRKERLKKPKVLDKEEELTTRQKELLTGAYMR